MLIFEFNETIRYNKINNTLPYEIILKINENVLFNHTFSRVKGR